MLLERTLPHCGLPVDRTTCSIYQMKALIALGRLEDAVSTGLRALDDLNCPLPGGDRAAEIFAVIFLSPLVRLSC